jgi:hypothetical protein
MSDDLRASLLAAVLADPSGENCAVYADHLLALGDPRGDLIAVDLALETAAGVDRQRLINRRIELIQRHGGEWWPWMGEAATRPGFRTRHGFHEVTSLYVGPATDPELLAREALHTVHLSGRERHAPAVLRSSWIVRVSHLRLSVHDTDLATLGARRFPRLAALDLFVRSLGPTPLADGMPALERLSLSYIGWERGTVDFPALAAWPALARVRELQIEGWNALDVEPLLARAWPCLVELRNHSAVGEAFLLRLAAHAASFPALRRVVAPAATIEKPTVQALNAAGFTSLELRVQRHASTLALDPRYTVRANR